MFSSGFTFSFRAVRRTGYNVVMIRLEQVLDSWVAVRQDTAAAVEDMPADDLDFRPAADVMTFREIARHILDSTDGLIGVMLDGNEDFASPEFRPRMKKYMKDLSADASGPELAAALRDSIQKRIMELGKQPAEYLSHIITRFDGHKVTRLEFVQGLKEHEMTHRSQLFMCLRLRGIVPATTRRRLAMQAAR